MYTLKVALLLFIRAIYFIIIARAIMSWFIRDLRNPIARFLHEITEPLLAPIRALLQALGLGGTMFDFSPLVLFLLLQMLANFIVRM
ncbi:MAG: YggT family protein [Clostridia bacterium]|nr:YggT family protein [Clostridia bacterium]